MDEIFQFSVSGQAAGPFVDAVPPPQPERIRLKKYLLFSALIHLSLACLLGAHLRSEPFTQTGRIVPVSLVRGIDLQKDSVQTAIARGFIKDKAKVKSEIAAPPESEPRSDEIPGAAAQIRPPVDGTTAENPLPPIAAGENVPLLPASASSPSPWAVKSPPAFFSSNIKKYFVYVQDRVPGLIQRSLSAEGLDELKGKSGEVRILFNREGRIEVFTLQDSGEREILNRLFKEQLPWDSLLTPLHFGLPHRMVLLRIGVGEEGKISVFADLL